MYKLKAKDAFHPEAISDKNYSQIGGDAGLYEYSGPDPVGPSDDEKNSQIEADNAEEVKDLQNNADLVKETAVEVKDESEEANKETEYILTQEDLDKDPALVSIGLKVGDKIDLNQHE